MGPHRRPTTSPDEVCEAFGADPTRVRAVPHGLALPGDAGPTATARGGCRAPAAQLAAALTGCERYVLALGTVEPRKDRRSSCGRGTGWPATTPTSAWSSPVPTGGAQRRSARPSPRRRHRERIGRAGYVEGRVRPGLLAGAAVFAFPSVLRRLRAPAARGDGRRGPGRGDGGRRRARGVRRRRPDRRPSGTRRRWPGPWPPCSTTTGAPPALVGPGRARAAAVHLGTMCRRARRDLYRDARVGAPGGSAGDDLC